jgi:hypothetical protein
MEAGRVSTHAIARFRTVLNCSPVWLAAIVPATPDESTWAVLTGIPNQSAAPMVNIAGEEGGRVPFPSHAGILSLLSTKKKRSCPLSTERQNLTL